MNRRGIGCAILLQAKVIYVPLFQRISHTVSLDPGGWGIVVLMAGGLQIVEEVRKLIAPRLFNWGK